MNYRIYEGKQTEFSARFLEVLNLNEAQQNQLAQPNYRLSNNPAKCLQEAKQRILQAKVQNEKVFVAGDYDADGVMATCIMKDLLDQLGIENGYYIPNRFKDGYGLNSKIVQLAYEKGYRLIITVDNGVRAFEAIELAKSLGMDVIVTDHHLYEEPFDDVIVVHPDLMEVPFKKMCGAGMALEISKQFLEDPRHVMFAMIATIGDMMPLWDENRTIVQLGLSFLNEYKLPNIIKLLDKKTKYDEVDLAFQLIPRINSIGRLEKGSNPNALVNYFLSKKEEEINLIKNQINQKNQLRKQLSAEMIETCQSMIGEDSFILLADESFHEGICGLAAGSIVRTYQKPCLILSKKNNLYKGSGRGVDGFDLHGYLSQYKNLYETFGGHKMAVGISLNHESLEKLRVHIQENHLMIEPVYEDCVLVSIDEMNLENILNLQKFKPFGEGFRLPLCYMRDFEVESFQMLKGKYPKWTLKSNEKVEAICFQTDVKIIKNPQFMIFEPTINEFRGKLSLSLLVKSLG